ncbi:hypothetical protein CDIK_2738 [Cucumispora dikerogammari]|nr:hypothetical protein CDIK_2738 [Cucumispora dikerogammari]
MFSLIYNLLYISYQTESSRNEKTNLKIINCVNKKGDLVDDFFLSESSYQLTLLYDERCWVIYFDLYIRSLRFEVQDIVSLSSEFVKYNENIGICGNVSGFVVFFDDDLNSHKGYSANLEQTETDIINKETLSYKWSYPCKTPKKNLVYDQLVIEDSCLESDKTTRTNYIRKALGILKNRINVFVFKIRIICEVIRRDQEQNVIITFETESFGFSEDEGGNLVLKKAKKLRSCHKSLVKD